MGKHEYQSEEYNQKMKMNKYHHSKTSKWSGNDASGSLNVTLWIMYVFNEPIAIH